MRKSRLAIVSFILSLLLTFVPSYSILGRVIVYGTFNLPFGYGFINIELLTFGFAILAIVLGIIALIKIKRNNLEGKWLAVTGIVVSVILIVVAMIVFVSGMSYGIATP